VCQNALNARTGHQTGSIVAKMAADTIAGFRLAGLSALDEERTLTRLKALGRDLNENAPSPTLRPDREKRLA
jgi:hypothetical protein